MRAFAEVAEHGHFGRAAQALGMTQPGLSQLVKKLETSIGAELLHRTTRSVSLTDVGEMFLENARELLHAHHLADERLAHLLSGDEGTVRLGFVASAALGVVPQLAQATHKEAPGIRLSLVEMTSEEQIPRLKAGDIDAGVIREISDSPGLVITPLLQERLVLAVHRSHPRAGAGTVHLEDLSDEGFVMFPRTRISYLHDLIYRLCHQAGFTPHIVEQAVQFPTIVGLVSSNAGIAIVPRSVTAIRLPHVVFLDIANPDAVSEVLIARRRDERTSPATRRLVDIARSSFGR